MQTINIWRNYAFYRIYNERNQLSCRPAWSEIFKKIDNLHLLTLCKHHITKKKSNRCKKCRYHQEPYHLPFCYFRDSHRNQSNFLSPWAWSSEASSAAVAIFWLFGWEIGHVGYKIASNLVRHDSGNNRNTTGWMNLMYIAKIMGSNIQGTQTIPSKIRKFTVFYSYKINKKLIFIPSLLIHFSI